MMATEELGQTLACFLVIAVVDVLPDGLARCREVSAGCVAQMFDFFRRDFECFVARNDKRNRIIRSGSEDRLPPWQSREQFGVPLLLRRIQFPGKFQGVVIMKAE